MPALTPVQTLTPIPTAQNKPMTMSFFDALKKVQAGKMVTRIIWANKDHGLMKDGWLTIHTKGKYHSWLVNDGDMEGQDWIVVTEPN